MQQAAGAEAPACCVKNQQKPILQIVQCHELKRLGYRMVDSEYTL